jgi:hypothetical protein
MTSGPTKIENHGSSEYVSQLLGLMVQNLTGRGVPIDVAREPVPNKKTSLIVEIAIGLGISATWDLLKFAIGMLASSRQASAGDELIINGKKYKITEIGDNSPGEVDDKD